MKILENDKLFGKISLIDILVVFILIFVVIGVLMKYKDIEKVNDTQANTSRVHFEYSVKFENVRTTSGEMLRVDDVVFDVVSGTPIGTISSVLVKPTTLQIETMTGEIVNRDFEDRSDIMITVMTRGSIKNGEYMASDLIRILLGKTLEIKTKYITITGIITDIKKIED